jgi:tRNA-Thr(GGU) m(6)t(6)A37 methyltransferase TsaA
MKKDEQGACAASFTIIPIGLIHTPFKSATGTPIQGTASHGAQGVVELLPEFISGLKDLAGIERIWLIYLLDRASSMQLIVRPFMDTEERGVFSTRSPARPNPIGISAVRLLGVEENRLQIGDVDILDGTPLLDIKPYVPAFDSFEKSRAGWYANKSATSVVADSRFEARESE